MFFTLYEYYALPFFHSILDEMTNLMNSSLRGVEPPPLTKNDVSFVHVWCMMYSCTVYIHVCIEVL